MSDSVFTLADVAARWSCSMDVLYDMIRQKRLRAFKVGREYRVTSAEINRIEAGDET
jgi:excisionase family DNA binding protein